jgi:nucleotide-binding universal stress UspA family protein
MVEEPVSFRDRCDAGRQLASRLDRDAGPRSAPEFSLFAQGVEQSLESGDAPAPGSLAEEGVPTRTTGEHAGCPIFRHLLVPLDGSALAERALPVVAALADVFASRITLLRVLEPADPASTRGVDVVEWEMARTEAHSHLTHLDGELKGKGLLSTVEVMEGRAAEQIIQFAKHHQVDLIALSTHGAGGLTGWPLSSTIQKVVARACTSVLIVPAYATQDRRLSEPRFGKILLPLDCSPRAECMLPLGVALARAHDGELILSHVVPEPEMPRRMSPSRDDLTLAAQLTERNQIEAERYLTDLQSHLTLQGVRTRVRVEVSPRPTRSIRALADREDVDLVVVAAHGRTGEASERYGNVAAQLIQECS